MTHDERMHQLLYSNEGRVEQCERICKLEELVRDLWDFTGETLHIDEFERRIRELEVED